MGRSFAGITGSIFDYDQESLARVQAGNLDRVGDGERTGDDDMDVVGGAVHQTRRQSLVRRHVAIHPGKVRRERPMPGLKSALILPKGYKASLRDSKSS